MTVLSRIFNEIKTPNSVAQFFVRLSTAVAIVLLIPLIAMQYTNEVNWDAFDFIAATVLLMGAGMTYKLVSVRLSVVPYRRGVGIAVGTSLVLIWTNLAVGIIGSEDHPANLMYMAVLASGFAAAVLNRFRPRRLFGVMSAMAAAVFLIPIIAVFIWQPEFSLGVVKVFIFNGAFALLYAASAQQFRKVSPAEANIEQ